MVSPGEEPRDITLERRQIDPVILPQSYRLEADPSLLAVDGVHLSDAGIAHNVERMLDAVGACT